MVQERALIAPWTLNLPLNIRPNTRLLWEETSLPGDATLPLFLRWLPKLLDPLLLVTLSKTDDRPFPSRLLSRNSDQKERENFVSVH